MTRSIVCWCILFLFLTSVFAVAQNNRLRDRLNRPPSQAQSSEQPVSATAATAAYRFAPTRVQQAEINRFLARHGRDVKAADRNGDTLLHKAARKWENSPSSPGRGGRTEILGFELYSAWNVAVAKYLVSQGANVNAKNNVGETPLHSVIDLPDAAIMDTQLEIARFLVSQGADVNARDSRGKTPLDLAKEQQNTELIRYLSNVPSVPVSQPVVRPPAPAPQELPALRLPPNGVRTDKAFIAQLRERAVERLNLGANSLALDVHLNYILGLAPEEVGTWSPTAI